MHRLSVNKKEREFWKIKITKHKIIDAMSEIIKALVATEFSPFRSLFTRREAVNFETAKGIPLEIITSNTIKTEKAT